MRRHSAEALERRAACAPARGGGNPLAVARQHAPRLRGPHLAARMRRTPQEGRSRIGQERSAQPNRHAETGAASAEAIMITIPPTVPPLPRDDVYSRHLPAGAAFAWLRAGWRDLIVRPGLSLLYGLAVFLASLAVVGGCSCSGGITSCFRRSPASWWSVRFWPSGSTRRAAHRSGRAGDAEPLSSSRPSPASRSCSSARSCAAWCCSGCAPR